MGCGLWTQWQEGVASPLHVATGEILGGDTYVWSPDGCVVRGVLETGVGWNKKLWLI